MIIGDRRKSGDRIENLHRLYPSSQYCILHATYRNKVRVYLGSSGPYGITTLDYYISLRALHADTRVAKITEIVEECC